MVRKSRGNSKKRDVNDLASARKSDKFTSGITIMCKPIRHVSKKISQDTDSVLEQRSRKDQEGNDAYLSVLIQSFDLSQLVPFDFHKNRIVDFGLIYLNDLSSLRVLELVNLQPQAISVQLSAEIKKPYQSSAWSFQLDNENIACCTSQKAIAHETCDKYMEYGTDQYNSYAPSIIVRPSLLASLCSVYAHLEKGYNELFNCIDKVSVITLQPNERKKVYFSLCSRIDSQTSDSTEHVGNEYASLLLRGAKKKMSHGPNSVSEIGFDSSEEERMQLSKTSCFLLRGNLSFSVQLSKETKTADDYRIQIPIQGQACQSLLRLDVKELHFDDCVPGKSYVKDFTIWNRSEIPLLLKVTSSLTNFEETRHLIKVLDYNTDYDIEDKTMQVAAYGHVRVRIMYRPDKVGERNFEIQAQNLHDSRNIKTLKVHAVANKEQHREGIYIKQPGGPYIISRSRLDFGDCYTGMSTSKTLLIKNTTDKVLQVELSSDRSNEIQFQLMSQPNRNQASRPSQFESANSSPHQESSDDLRQSFGFDSDEEIDDNEEFLSRTEMAQQKRPQLEDYMAGENEDIDDDFEFDGDFTTRALKSRTRKQKVVTDGGFKQCRSKKMQLLSRVTDLATYESGADSSYDWCSPAEQEHKAKVQWPQARVTKHDPESSNFLVETIDLPPGVERTILVLYCPPLPGPSHSDSLQMDDATDMRHCRLTKQQFRLSFRCLQVSGSWQQTQSRVYDRTLEKYIHARARICTSIISVSPTVLHLGDCNIGELKSGSCLITNHAELSTTVKTIVTSKVISTIPNEEILLGPKQSVELKLEIIPRKINANYSKLVSIVNMRNHKNSPSVCVRSSNMDAHDVIYHSLFYKLITRSRSAFLNFDCVVSNSPWVQYFDLENITNDTLPLGIKTSDVSKLRLYALQAPAESSDTQRHRCINSDASDSIAASSPRPVANQSQPRRLLSPVTRDANVSFAAGVDSAATSVIQEKNVSSIISSWSECRLVRRRRSFGCAHDLGCGLPSTKTNKNISYHHRGVYNHGSVHGAKPLYCKKGDGSPYQALDIRDERRGSTCKNTVVLVPEAAITIQEATEQKQSDPKRASASSFYEVSAIVDAYEHSRAECDTYCGGNVTSPVKEQEIYSLIRDRWKKLQAFISEREMVPLNQDNPNNLHIRPKARVRVVVILESSLSPKDTKTVPTPHNWISDPCTGLRVEKYKIFITLPLQDMPNAVHLQLLREVERSTSEKQFTIKPLTREMLLKSRVGRSYLNVNQKNINFGRMTTSSKCSKKLVVQNMAALPLVYRIVKTGSISSNFLAIKHGEHGIVKPFGTKELCFEFHPSLPGPFEETLKIVNVQDAENSVAITIKAKVVKKETFKVLAASQHLDLGKCLLGEKSPLVAIRVRNTSKKRRDYVAQVDPNTCFSVPSIRPSLYFRMEYDPYVRLTQAQERKLDEELEKLEHKLRIATTKKKAEKICKLEAKIKSVRALLSGEQLVSEQYSDSACSAVKVSTFETSDSASDSDSSDTENSFSYNGTSGGDDLSILDIEHERSDIYRLENTFERTCIHAPVPRSSTDTDSVDSISFTIDAEAVARITMYAVFPISPKVDKTGPQKNLLRKEAYTQRKTYKMYRCKPNRGHKVMDDACISGFGKLLLFEQQNKDVVKEMQFVADIYNRSALGEAAYYAAIGKSPLPPFPANLNLRHQALSTSSEARSSAYKKYANQTIELKTTAHAKSKNDEVANSPDNLTVAMDPTVSSSCTRGSDLLILLEESPVTTVGWNFYFSVPPSIVKFYDTMIKITWEPLEVNKNVLSFTRDSLNHAATSAETSCKATTDDQGQLPQTLMLSSDNTKQIRLRWRYAPVVGYASSTTLSAALNRSIRNRIRKHTEVKFGCLIFQSTMQPKSALPNTTHTGNASAVKSFDVYVGKGIIKRLHVDEQQLDLGEQQQDTTILGEFNLHNRSKLSINYLLLADSSQDGSEQTSVAQEEWKSTRPISHARSNSCIAFQNSTGRILGEESVTIRFSYSANQLGCQNEQILIRNLNDRADFATVNVSVRVMKPVYIRIPDLDPHCTGILSELNFGHCYVSPETQSLNTENCMRSFQFSKVRKLTLHSQARQTLILCATSNLKTQCYIFKDYNLCTEASHIVLKEMSSIDLYIAVRPRLPSDAFKMGSVRDFVGGIRVQISSYPQEHTLHGSPCDNLTINKSKVIAEFTIKFVGIAGTSVFKVSPMLIDFGTKKYHKTAQGEQLYCGQFTITNNSKGLPLQYRFDVPEDSEQEYSDEATSLRILLKRQKGEIAPNESEEVRFTIAATRSGYFHRKIVVSNVHCPRSVIAVNVMIFMDSGTMRSQFVLPQTSVEDALAYDFGKIHVVQDKRTSPGVNAAGNLQSYRMYDHGSCVLNDGTLFKRILSGSNYTRIVKLTNESARVLCLRPVGTLPLLFGYSQNYTSDNDSATHQIACKSKAVNAKLARQYNLHELPNLLRGMHRYGNEMFAGDIFELKPKQSCYLHIQLSRNVLFPPELAHALNAGDLTPFHGMVLIQSFCCDDNKIIDEMPKDCAVSSKSDQYQLLQPYTLKTLRISGFFGEPHVQLAEKSVSLGKIGEIFDWKPSTFQVVLKNKSQITAYFAISNVPQYITIQHVEGASPIYLARIIMDSGMLTTSLKFIALRSYIHHSNGTGIDGSAVLVWCIEPMQEAVVHCEFIRDEKLIAGLHNFSLKFLNMMSIRNQQVLAADVEIINDYLEITMDPDSINVSPDGTPCKSCIPSTKQRSHAHLPPVTVPPVLDSHAGHGCNFWFRLKNLYDEELLITVSCLPTKKLASTLEFHTYSRSSNTILHTIQLTPNETFDVRIVCRVCPSARLPTTVPTSDDDSEFAGDSDDSIIKLGRVRLKIQLLNAICTPEVRRIVVFGRLLRGRTIAASTSALHFYAVANRDPAEASKHTKKGASDPDDSDTLCDKYLTTSPGIFAGLKPHAGEVLMYIVQNPVEGFWLRNPSERDSVNYVIDSMIKYQPGCCLYAGKSHNTAHVIHDYVRAVASPASGKILPLDSIRILVHLEEVSSDEFVRLLAHSESVADEAQTSENIAVSDSKLLAQSQLHAMRHHPFWRSNSWDGEFCTSGMPTPNSIIRTKIIVRDTDGVEAASAGIASEIDINIVLQAHQNYDSSANNNHPMPNTLVNGADKDFPVNQAILAKVNDETSLMASLTQNNIELMAQTSQDLKYTCTANERIKIRDGSYLCRNFDDRNVQSNRTLSLRGCTPCTNSNLQNTRYFIDIGQHMIRINGEIEWEITIECEYARTTEGCLSLDPIEYRLSVSESLPWLRLSRDRGSLNRARTFQTIVLHFLRDCVGIYSTYLTLQNISDPMDLKIIHVRFEVVTDLNLLRSMSDSSIEVGVESNLFRVLVSQQYHAKAQSHKCKISDHEEEKTDVAPPSILSLSKSLDQAMQSQANESQQSTRFLIIDYGEVYYHRLYHNHSIVLLNSSSLRLDFMLSSNAQPQELCFSISPTSFKHISTVNLPPHARVQVFLHFRPELQDHATTPDTCFSELDKKPRLKDNVWKREIEVYITCRLVRDFRETVYIKAICKTPQLSICVASDVNLQGMIDSLGTGQDTHSLAEINGSINALAAASTCQMNSLLGIIFPNPDSQTSTLKNACQLVEGEYNDFKLDNEQYVLVRNKRCDKHAQIAVRNNTLFFSVGLQRVLVNGVDIVGSTKTKQNKDQSYLSVTLPPESTAILWVRPRSKSLWKNRQLFDHTAKEHIALYNLLQYAEHCHISLCFSCSNMANLYISPSIAGYALTALEDTIAQFLQRYQKNWISLLSAFDQHSTDSLIAGADYATENMMSPETPILQAIHKTKTDWSRLAARLTKILDAICYETGHFDGQSEFAMLSHDQPRFTSIVRKKQSQQFRELYFDFYCITDEIVWYGVRGENGRSRVFMIANLLYGTIFNHDVFEAFKSQAEGISMTKRESNCDYQDSKTVTREVSRLSLPTLLKPWVQQLGHFLSFFPENEQEASSLRATHEQLWCDSDGCRSCHV